MLNLSDLRQLLIWHCLSLRTSCKFICVVSFFVADLPVCSDHFLYVSQALLVFPVLFRVFFPHDFYVGLFVFRDLTVKLFCSCFLFVCFPP